MVPTQAVVIIILLLFFLWLSGLSYVVYQAIKRYTSLTADLDKKDIVSVLNQLKKQTKTLDGIDQQLQKDIDAINHRLQHHIQKLGFIRYNPFGNTGGDHSFCLTLLDEHNNGILITSLHTRSQTRLYTKKIVSGKPGEDAAELSKEEEASLKQAIKWSSL